MTDLGKCKICGEHLAPLFEVQGYPIKKCLACGFGQVDVTLEEIAAFYDKAYFDGEKARFAQAVETVADPAHRRWLEMHLGSRSRPAFSVLEIGPGLGGQYGRILRGEWPQAAYEAIEFSEFAAARLTAEGFKIHQGRVCDRQILKDCAGRFDLVIGTEVIEHDPDPLAFASSVAAFLKPGGVCAFTTGNLDGWVSRFNGPRWYYLDPPAHVSYFTPKSIRMLFEQAGLKNTKVRRIGFNHIALQLKVRVPGVLWLVDLLGLPTGMSVSATR